MTNRAITTAATGTVTTFDEQAGHGIVTGDDERQLFFHCTAIADGSRAITPGRAVRFAMVAGRWGRWEATAIEPT